MTITVKEAIEHQHTYIPSAKVISELGKISLAPIVGPTAVGKNHLMKVLTSERGYHQAGNIVSRDLRDNDPPNVQHRVKSELLKDIENGEVIQFAVFEKSGDIYATDLGSYKPHQINTKDIYAHSIDSFMNYGFRDVKPICMVVPPTEWEPRLDSRFETMVPEHRASRLDEAEQSITWILEGSPSISRVIVMGMDDYTQENVERVKTFVEDDEDVTPEQLHIDTAEKMLASIPILRGKYLEKGSY